MTATAMASLTAAACAVVAVVAFATGSVGSVAARRPAARRSPAAPRIAFVRAIVRTVEALRQPRRDRRELAEHLPEVVEALARSVRSGSSIRGAITATATGATGAAGRDLVHLAARLDHGTPLNAVLDEWRHRRSDVRDVALVTVALRIAADAGGSVAQALDGVADTIRGEQHLRAEIRALASQAEASALLVALLPLAFGFIAGAADPSTITFLVSTPVGLVCLAGGVALDAGALVWMRRITAGIES